MKGLTILKRFPIWKLAAAVLVLLCLYVIFAKAGKISSDVKENACKVVSEFGLDCAKVLEVKGRDVLLKGEIGPEIEKNKLLKKVASVRGVRSVEDKLSPYVLERPWLKVKISKEQITIEGLLPNSVSIEDIKKLLSQKFPNRNIEIKIMARPKVATADWINDLPDMLDLVAQADDAEIEISDKGIKISGYVSSQAKKVSLVKKLREIAENLPVINWLVVKVPEEILLEEALSDIISEEPITFIPGTAQLTMRSEETLDEIARILKKYPDIKLEVAAYMDSVGDDEYNLELSKKRAENVVNYLISKGVPSERLVAKGYGEANPVASNESAAGRIKNRRIEFKIILENKS